MSKFEVLKEISKGIRAFQKLVELDKNEQGAKVGQKYTEVRKLVTSWLNTRQSLESPNDLVRLEKAGSPLWKIFFKTVDEFITLRLKRTTKIAVVEDLDKDCLKNLSKLIFERNQATEIGIESISPWDSARISDVLAKNLHLPLMRHLVEILESETAEKNWEPVLESLVHARDLAIVIFYSNENVAAKSVPGEEPRKQRISLEVRGQSGNFVDVLLNMVKKGLEDINLEVPVFRQKTNLPMEIVDLLAAIQERNEYEAKLSHFHRLRAELFSSLDRESFAPSSTFITSFIDFVKTLEYILERDPSQGLLMTDSVLDLASLICDKMAIAFENGDLERFFRILFVEVKRVSRELDSCWKWIELAHDKAEQDRREHPGELLFASTVLKKYAEVQKTLASEKQENIRKYSSWVTETMQELLEEHFPKGKYWKSAKPQHSEWFVEVNEQISCLVVRSCKNYSSTRILSACIYVIFR
jgi:hypothetical protein